MLVWNIVSTFRFPTFHHLPSHNRNFLCELTASFHSATQCYCASSITSPSTVLASSNCASSCGGDSSQLCGGSWAINIYSLSAATGTTSVATSTTGTVTTTSSAATSTSSAWTKLGCYQDANTRALAGYSTTISTLTPSSCQTTCAGLGYTYAGVEYCE